MVLRNLLALAALSIVGVAFGISLNIAKDSGIKADPTKVVVSLITETPTKKPTRTATVTATNAFNPSPTATRTAIPTYTELPSATPVASATPFPSSTPTEASGLVAPYPGAPLCSDSGSAHNNSLFHTLWDEVRGCHYDHEHGDNPFTQEVAETFPGFDLHSLLGGVEIGHTNPSSPAENTDKHGGFKWQVDLSIPCEVFESSDYCIVAAVVQYHWFGNSAIEMNSRIHSLTALVKACDPNNLNDCEFIYVTQHTDFGQRVSQYQGDLMVYPDNPQPSYPTGLFSYFTIDRYGTCFGCRPSLAFVRDRKINANGVWTSKGDEVIGSGSTVLQALLRNRDMYQLKDDSDQTYPFTFGWLCSSDNGLSFNPAGCRYTNTTTRVHELMGVIPAEWDNLVGFDTNPATGVIDAEGYVTRFGEVNGPCSAPGMDCHPIKIVNGKPGSFGGALPGAKVSNPTCVSNPSRNIWFLNGIWLPGGCAETNPGAVPSGWIGPNN